MMSPATLSTTPLIEEEEEENNEQQLQQVTTNTKSSSSWPNISEWIAHAIANTGCKVVYGGHGGALVPLVNAICNHPELTWVCARNEHDAAEMAAAHAVRIST
jgi:hypothetical protein